MASFQKDERKQKGQWQRQIIAFKVATIFKSIQTGCKLIQLKFHGKSMALQNEMNAIFNKMKRALQLWNKTEEEHLHGESR